MNEDKRTQRPELDGDERTLADNVVARLSSDVEPDVAARLRAARQEAVYLAERRARRRAPWLVPAGGLVAASVVAVVLLREPGLQPMPAMDETEMAAAAEIALLEDLEMLAWLDEEMLDAG